MIISVEGSDNSFKMEDSDNLTLEIGVCIKFLGQFPLPEIILKTE